MTLKGRYVLLFRKYLYFRSGVYRGFLNEDSLPILSPAKMQFYTDIHEGCVKTKRAHQNDSAAVDNGDFQHCHLLVP